MAVGAGLRPRRTLLIMAVILAIAALLRLAALDRVQPGVDVDEGCNAWNAWCLLKTGMDQHGVRWPIFYTRAFGENRTIAGIYAMLPFQAIGGLNLWTTRLPMALAGTLSALLAYWVGKRMFGPYVGLVAAGLLALNPWSIQVSRIGLEASLLPLQLLICLAMLIWAGAPLTDEPGQRLRPARALVAGLVIGAMFYGYLALRIFLPVFVLAVLVLTWRRWWWELKSRRGSLAIAALLIGGACTFGPLVWRHVYDPNINNRMARPEGWGSWVWSSQDSFGTKIGKVLARYPSHFGPDFLFMHGDRYPMYNPPEMGAFHWYAMPLMLAGAVTLIRRARHSAAARVLLAWLALYPLSDMLARHYVDSPYMLRSLPGLPALILLAAVGAVAAWQWLWTWRRRLAPAVLAAMGVAVLACNVRFLHAYFGQVHNRERISIGNQVGLLDASRQARPLIEQADSVFVTTRVMNQPYVAMLMGLQYDPERWFDEPRQIIVSPDGLDDCTRFGRVFFLFGYSETAKDELKAMNAKMQSGGHGRAVFIIRPGEIHLPPTARPVFRLSSRPVPLDVYELSY